MTLPVTWFKLLRRRFMEPILGRSSSRRIVISSPLRLGAATWDPIQLFQTTVPGFVSEVDLLAQSPSGILADDDCLVHAQADLNRISTTTYPGFVPKDVTLNLSADGTSLQFEPVAIQTLNRIIRFSSTGQMVDIPGNNPVT